MAVEDVVGVIKRITKLNSKNFPRKQGKTFTVYSIGIQLGDGKWHNIKNTKEDKVWDVLQCKELDRRFQIDDEVKMYIEAEDTDEKYWKVTAITIMTPTDSIVEEEVKDGPYEELSPETKKELKGVDLESKPTPVPPPKDMDKVEGFKTIEANKYELGMAKNIAGGILASFIGNLDPDSQRYKDTVINLPKLWTIQTKRIYEAGKELRKELLGY